MILGLAALVEAVLVEHRLTGDGQTDGQTMTAYTALAQRRVVKTES